MAEKWQNEPSEFGGYPGEVQPPPHTLDAAELARMQRRVDPADAGTSPEQLATEYMATGGAPAAGMEDAK